MANVRWDEGPMILVGNKPVIYLDIDGVLNTHDFDVSAQSNPIHRDKVAILNHIIAETDSLVVISSAWRYIVHRGDATLEGFDWLLRSHGLLANRVIGLTQEDTMIDGKPLSNERGIQITEWQTKHQQIGRYVVLDDLDLGILYEGHPLVLVEGDLGLSWEDAKQAIAILAGKNFFPPALQVP